MLNSSKSLPDGRIFCRITKISLRKKTHASQKTPEQLRKTIFELHTKTLRERERSWRILFKDLANMVQTPLPFVLEKGRGSVNRKWPITLRKTYIYHSIGSVCWRWNTSHAYHLSRTRFTNQCSGKKEFDRSVKVAFQPKAYCDENIMNDIMIFQNIRRILRAASEKTTSPTNQLLLPTTRLLHDLADTSPKRFYFL